MRSLGENLELRASNIDLAIAKSIQQGQGLRFSHEDRTLEVFYNELITDYMALKSSLKLFCFDFA